MEGTDKKYTLSELALAIGVSPSWVNKVQARTGIGGHAGKRGVRVSFSEGHLYIFRSVKLLRILEYSLTEIKKIYDTEKKMLACKAINSKYKTQIKGEGYHYIIHPYNFTYDEHAHAGKDMQEYDIEIADYKRWAEDIYRLSTAILASAVRLGDELKDFTMSILKNAEAGSTLPEEPK